MTRVCVIIGLVAIFGVSFILCGKAPVEQCPGLNYENLREHVEVSPCGKTKCVLHKGTNIIVDFTFKTKSKVTSLKHNVVAIVIGGLELPFVGVTGTDACSGVTRNGAPTPCPLEPDTEYQLKSIIPVESYYPTIGQLTVKWGLRDQNDKNVICFTVPAAIKDAKTKKTK